MVLYRYTGIGEGKRKRKGKKKKKKKEKRWGIYGVCSSLTSVAEPRDLKQNPT
jgi:hypothetical protein